MTAENIGGSNKHKVKLHHSLTPSAQESVRVR